MVFKLVRIDTQEPSKIQLLIGTHVIGRGKFLHDDDTDKRVSRNHAELEVTGDTVTLKSLHHNPCFYIKKSTEETQLLQQDCTISLCHGDKFGLIPDNFWYEVLHSTNQDNMDVGPGIHENERNGVDSRDEGIEENDNNQIVDEAEEGEEQNDAFSETSSVGENDEALNLDENSEAAGSNRSASPSTLMSADQECTEDYEVPPQVPSDNDVKSPKRSHSPSESSPPDVKKVKIEPNANPGDVMAGPSNDQQASSDSDNKVKTDAPGSPVKPPPPPLRERCMYGVNCYRRNPAHKAVFAHPGDADWGGGARGECPYGRACRRQDPRHWDTHDHPPGVVQPIDPNGPRPGKRQKRRQRKVSKSDEDSLVDDVIVTGKRARKKVNRQSWSGSESEGDEDPYKTDDESDEWQPPSDVSNSQGFSQDF